MNRIAVSDLRRECRARAVATLLVACGLVAGIAAPLRAQDDAMTPIPTPAQPDAIVLGTGALAGADVDESWHRQYGRVFARNVRVATLTPFLPAPEKATGSAVIVARNAYRAAASDVATGVELLGSSVRSAALSIDGNLAAIKDASYTARVRAEQEQLAADSARDAGQAFDAVNGAPRSRR